MATEAKHIFINRQVLLLGDSLTQRGFEPNGWAAGLADIFIRKADIVNRGLSGYNTRWVLEILDRLVPTQPGEKMLAVIWFGANDAARPDGPPHSTRQHVPVSEFKYNLSKIVAHTQAQGFKRILLITPPPIYNKGRKAHQYYRMGDEAKSMTLDRTDDFTSIYAESVKSLGSEIQVPVLDLFQLLRQDLDLGMDEELW
eukprot:CAMPEP_0175087374 /NCGR_PEP_ID=MMETSP0052_2-20121109/29794_1 /TAXON_ID=51329 ORGANISM="Polytomella parva, Strain SAG 63-3" /NCGR_SAMPLE_ID=MMETSP0052_2 /ASSEMBLY_ACC=CAM_ASM_000194 /LENGTH=198 /DNA_ID=CAMNT_0016359711 /DNA_START=103 /DNA_END=696 /DNA_ORIENTATION=-